ncbi:hypothetical protein SKC41_01095 [Mycobacterium sp. 050128]|uniref:hypothetical protein n=1 Tax=Mycobacterium sp. 050128 TaxID=3096112 RepID=UPI002ED9DC92
MGLAPPTGEYAVEMLAPNAWPESDEDVNFDRAEQYMRVLRQVSDVADNCRHQQLEIFDSNVWSGSASGAADSEVGTLVAALATLQNGLATVITWHRTIARSIIQAKSDIYDNVDVAERKIDALANEFRLTEAERTEAIRAVVTATHEANAGVVTATAEQILASKAWTPPDTALQDLLDQKAPPGRPGDDEPSDTDPALPGPVAPPPPGPVAPPPVGPAIPQPSLPGLGAPTIPGWSPATPAAATPGHTTPGSGPTTPGTVRRPAASERDGSDGPADPLLPDAAPYGVGPQDDSPRVAPASASVMPAMPMAPGAAGAGAAAGSASGAGPGGGGVPGVGGPAGRVSRGQSAGVRPAAATHRPAPRAEGVAHRETVDAGQVAEVNAIAAIPVSPARLERDAIADAATADAARRRGADPLQLARRIAAALNAPVGDKGPDLGFFWVTGVTTDGAIVVANSYGLAYIPDGVQLPEPVFMATAEDAIPAAERASWATYPVVAVQGWVAHRDAELRAVIGTAEQFADSDPGVAQLVLDPDDIPESGEMIGRSRLEVVNPEAAERLAQTPDAQLLALLPPAPADANPPGNERIRLWLQVMKPMATTDPLRQTPHLQAFHAYVSHAQGAVVNDAYAAADPVAQRCAIADWFYWKHLAELLDAALSITS